MHHTALHYMGPHVHSAEAAREVRPVGVSRIACESCTASSRLPLPSKRECSLLISAAMTPHPNWLLKAAKDLPSICTLPAFCSNCWGNITRQAREYSLQGTSRSLQLPAAYSKLILLGFMSLGIRRGIMSLEGLAMQAPVAKYERSAICLGLGLLHRRRRPALELVASFSISLSRLKDSSGWPEGMPCKNTLSSRTHCICTVR